MVNIKSHRELEIMRQSGRLVSKVLTSLVDMVAPGVTLEDLDREAERLTLSFGAKPAFKGYMGYRHTLCTSVNEQVVHGIPSARALNDGDIVGLDFGLIVDGFYGDSAVTVPVGKISAESAKLMTTTRNALYAAIALCRPGKTLKDLARAIEQTVLPHGYGIVREFVGHGIGQKLHEAPQIPNYEAGVSNFQLRPGMTICIEPMINAGSASVKVLSDRWTAVTTDGKPSAHFEHTIAVTEGDPEVLTEWNPPSFSRVFEELQVSG